MTKIKYDETWPPFHILIKMLDENFANQYVIRGRLGNVTYTDRCFIEFDTPELATLFRLKL